MHLSFFRGSFNSSSSAAIAASPIAGCDVLRSCRCCGFAGDAQPRLHKAVQRLAMKPAAFSTIPAYSPVQSPSTSGAK